MTKLPSTFDDVPISKFFEKTVAPWIGILVSPSSIEPLILLS